MKNKVYYGEYSIKHWVDLILKKNVILPEYQRYFVWDEKRTRALIKSLKEELYIPPITIGAFSSDGINRNLILDGQQRLTSIFLAYLGIFPDKESINKESPRDKSKDFQDENDYEEEDDDGDNILNWTFRNLLEKGNTKENIIKNISKTKYKPIDFDIDNSFLENTYLGFTYLIPKDKDEKYQQSYFSSTFRNINIQGITLLPQESRAALYYLDKDKVHYFLPQFIDKLLNRIDFVRYLSILSEYEKSKSLWTIARGCRSKMEKYYEDYIYSTINDDSDSIFIQFSQIFPNEKFERESKNLEKIINLIDSKKRNSIIDIDVIYLGLIYTIYFKKKNINKDKLESLSKELNAKIKEFRDDMYHSRSPGALKYLRQRLFDSLTIYEKYEQ